MGFEPHFPNPWGRVYPSPTPSHQHVSVRCSKSFRSRFPALEVIQLESEVIQLNSEVIQLKSEVIQLKSEVYHLKSEVGRGLPFLYPFPPACLGELFKSFSHSFPCFGSDST